MRPGLPTLAEIVGERVVRRAADWLGLNFVDSVNSEQGWSPPVEFVAPRHGPPFPLELYRRSSPTTSRKSARLIASLPTSRRSSASASCLLPLLVGQWSPSAIPTQSP